MGFDVKITTFFSPLDLIAPFTCRGCGRLGGLLCECCKNYNIQHLVGLYLKEEVPVYAVAYREGVMMRLVEDFKYKSIRATAGVLAELMDAAVPCLTGGGGNSSLRSKASSGNEYEVVVVPLPTIGRHIRERGFDHTWLLAKKLAKRRGFKAERILERRNKTVQVGANEAKRQEQARKAYGVVKKYLRGTGERSGGTLNDEVGLDPEKAYLLIDDVWTTGASMKAAISAMKKAGAKKIVAAVMLAPKNGRVQSTKN